MYQLLTGLSIVEVSSFVASPTAGLYCAQMGAEVIRIDDRRGGLDYKRYMMTREGRSLSWENLNRAKKSVALDLQTAEGRELAVELAQKTGQLITNLPLDSFMAHDRIAAGRRVRLGARFHFVGGACRERQARPGAHINTAIEAREIGVGVFI